MKSVRRLVWDSAHKAGRLDVFMRYRIGNLVTGRAWETIWEGIDVKNDVWIAISTDIKRAS